MTWWIIGIAAYLVFCGLFLWGWSRWCQRMRELDAAMEFMNREQALEQLVADGEWRGGYETATCVYCGQPWKLSDGMCHKCQNGAKAKPGTGAAG